MTVYELFERAYKHYIGQSFAAEWNHHNKKSDPREDAEQAFLRAAKEYSVVYAYDRGLKLENNPADKTLLKVEDLREIVVEAGYWLCHYDGHTGDWIFWWYESRAEAKGAYRRLYMRVFRHQDWFWICKVPQHTSKPVG